MGSSRRMSIRESAAREARGASNRAALAAADWARKRRRVGITGGGYHCNYFYIVDNCAMPPDYIGEFEQLVLMTILRLGEHAYGATVRDEIADRTGRDVSLSAVYTTLERLEHKKLLRSRIGEPTPQRGGRRKRYFALSAAGEHALQASWQRLKRVAEGLEPLLGQRTPLIDSRRATSDERRVGISQMEDRLRPVAAPPRLARVLLRLRTPRRLHEWMAGDLEEAYHHRVARQGVRAARRWYWRQVRATVVPGWARRMDVAPTRGEPLMTGMMTDLRDGARVLLRSPGFTAVAVLMLALGIGVNTTVFSWLNAVLLSPLPGAQDPNHIVQVGTTFKGNIDTSFSYIDYQYLRSIDGFAGMAARSERPLTLSVPQETGVDGTPTTSAPERVWCELVSDNFFRLLGVQPVVGRTFLPSEVRGPGDAPVTVISDAVWARHFDRDPAAVGRAVLVNGTPVTVIGVAPPIFQGSVPALAMDLWLPITQPALVAPDLQQRAPDDARVALARGAGAAGAWSDHRPGPRAICRRLRVAGGQAQPTRRRPGHGVPAPRLRGRQHRVAAAGAPRAGRCCWTRAAHRVRESGQPTARARLEPQARVGCPRGVGSQPQRLDAAALCRKRPAGGRWRRRGTSGHRLDVRSADGVCAAVRCPRQHPRAN